MYRPAIPLALAASLVASRAAAQEQDAQLWLFLNTTLPVAEAAHATLEISPRWREGDDQVLLRATGEWEASENVTLGAGAAFVDYAGGHEFRPHQQLTFARGPLSTRTRFEQRLFSGADRAQLRLRQRVQLAFPLDPDTQIAGSGEFLYVLQSEVPGSAARRDQWRGELGVRRRIGESVSLSASYRAIYSPRSGREDSLSHVSVLSIAWRL